MKYIVIGNKHFEYPIIFLDNLPHITISESICKNLELEHLKLKPISAGFIEIDNCKCFGESESLKVKSRKKDSTLLNTFWLTHGIKGLV